MQGGTLGSLEVMHACAASPASLPLLYVVLSMRSEPGQGGGEGAGLPGTVTFAKVPIKLWCRWEDLLPSQAAETLAYKLVGAVD